MFHKLFICHCSPSFHAPIHGTAFKLDYIKEVLHHPVQRLQLQRFLAQWALVLLPLFDAELAIHVHAGCAFLGVIHEALAYDTLEILRALIPRVYPCINMMFQIGFADSEQAHVVFLSLTIS